VFRIQAVIPQLVYVHNRTFSVWQLHRVARFRMVFL
jgi:hypothetical protein